MFKDEYTLEDYDYNEEEYYYNEGSNEVNLGLTKSTSYCIIKEKEINVLRDRLIQIAEEFTSLNREDVILALLYFNWNIDKLQQEWFDNTEKCLVESGIEISKESQKSLFSAKVFPNNKKCLVCYMEEAECPGGFYSLKCGHNLCVECWTEFLKAHMSDVRLLLYTRCPQKDCNLAVPENVFFKFFSNDSDYTEKINQGIHNNFTDCNSDVKWCPNTGCEAAVRCESKSNKEIECICGNNFCFKCLREGHRPSQCDMVEIWDKKNTSESENIKWISANTKQCPKCKKHIEKNQGCNHMTCQKVAGGCGHEFCWICFAGWKGHSACNKFDMDKDAQNEKNVKNLKLEIEKYIHYFTRYQNHAKALTLGVKMRKSIEYSIELLNNVKNVPLLDLMFLREGVDTIIKSRRLLKYTYVFGYYLTKCNEKSLFEHIQSKLESHADRLHELLENETVNNLLLITNYNEFSTKFQSFRNSIVDLFSATNTFVSNMINEIENKMLHLVDYKKMNEK